MSGCFFLKDGVQLTDVEAKLQKLIGLEHDCQCSSSYSVVLLHQGHC